MHGVLAELALHPALDEEEWRELPLRILALDEHIDAIVSVESYPRE